MSKTEQSVGPSPGGWSAVGSHDWDGPVGIESDLLEVLESVDATSEPLFAHVDVEALVEVISPGADRGASQVCFEVGDREVMVAQDGTIATRRRRA